MKKKRRRKKLNPWTVKVALRPSGVKLVYVGVWRGVVRLFVVCVIVCCCLAGRHLSVVGCVSVIVNALAVVSCTNTTCHVYDGSPKRYL